MASSAATKRGAFIVIEGLDRSGKSTQAAALLKRLEESGVRAVLHKFPDRTTTIGKMIDGYLRSATELDDRAIHLLFSANRWELAASIERQLSDGILVLCDRYAFSGIAFSAAKGLPYDWCASPDAGLPAPDATLFFDVTPEAARTRGGFGEERYEKEEMQSRVRDIFGNIGLRMGERWNRVDAGRSIQDVEESVWTIMENYVGGVDGPVSRLWPDISS
ncbi:thymidylate kinase [Peniophora sp. CONT]|nr:thymidylate kinase [Peniophora sp. CONT]